MRAADKHWRRVGNAVNAKGTSIYFASPSCRSLSPDIVSHIMRFCFERGVPYVDSRGLRIGRSVCVPGREELGGEMDLMMLITLFWSNERLVIMIQCNHP